MFGTSSDERDIARLKAELVWVKQREERLIKGVNDALNHSEREWSAFAKHILKRTLTDTREST